MNTWNERLAYALEKRGMKSSHLGKIIGVAPSSISQWLGTLEGKKETKNITAQNLSAVCEALNIRSDWLLHGIGPSGLDEELTIINTTKKSYPRVVGTAQCGDRGYYFDLEGGDGYLEFEAPNGSIAIRVRGDSMYPAIKDGWFVVIEPNAKLSVGEYALIKFKDGRKMVKEVVFIRDDCYIVESVNGGGRITAMKADLDGIEPITAVLPPSKHRDWI